MDLKFYHFAFIIMMLPQIEYPENCLKGIPNPEFVYSDGKIAAHLFHFNTNANRNDDWIEQSINWQDNEGVTHFTLDQRKEDGDYQFRIGIAVIPRHAIDGLRRKQVVAGLLSYERAPLENNPYHGNILLHNRAPKPTMKMIAAGIALEITEVVYRNR